MDPETQTALYFLLIGGGAGLSIGAVGIIILCAYLRDRKLKRRPKIVCLCGSTRFWREFQRAALQETLAGKIVLSIGAASGTDDEHFGNLQREEYDRVKEMLDDLHKRKIEMADEVLILNKGGYIGESTRSELLHAVKLGKEIKFLEKNSTSQMYLKPTP